MKLNPFYIPTCHPDETLTSFVSRVASMASRSARDFCLDMGLNFQALCDGDADEIDAFSELAGFDDGFPGTNFKRTGERWFELNGEPLPRASLRRATVRVCPHCIQEDLSRDVDHEKARPYGRWFWTIASIRTCSKHNTPLVVAAADDSPQMVHDFSMLLRPFVDDIDRHVDTAQSREPSDLETYLENRINGDRSDIWLSSLPAYAGARACEIIGATKFHGADVMAESLTEDQWYEAGQAGFEIAVRGAEGIRGYLDHMQQKFAETRHAWGPRQFYGGSMSGSLTRLMTPPTTSSGRSSLSTPSRRCPWDRTMRSSASGRRSGSSIPFTPPTWKQDPIRSGLERFSVRSA